MKVSIVQRKERSLSFCPFASFQKTKVKFLSHELSENYIAQLTLYYIIIKKSFPHIFSFNVLERTFFFVEHDFNA